MRRETVPATREAGRRTARSGTDLHRVYEDETMSKHEDKEAERQRTDGQVPTPPDKREPKPGKRSDS